jgi:hypothetical protein
MVRKLAGAFVILALILWSAQWLKGSDPNLKPQFHTSDRCFACHNELTTPNGQDVSIGLAWRSSIMANSARDPYWQASVRRETGDHPQAVADIEDECSVCHMPVTRYEAKLKGQKGAIFAHLPFDPDNKESAAAEDGVTLTRDLELFVSSANGKQSYEFKKGKRMNPVEAMLDLYNGDAMDYPFDEHEAALEMYFQPTTAGAAD